MATIKQHISSKTNWANAIWLGGVVMLGSWEIPGMDKWLTPEAVAFVSLVINVIMRTVTKAPLTSK